MSQNSYGFTEISNPFSSDFFFLIKVASSQLIMATQVAYKYAVNGTQGIYMPQNSYGYRVIWTWNCISTDFWILKDLRWGWFLRQI